MAFSPEVKPTIGSRQNEKSAEFLRSRDDRGIALLIRKQLIHQSVVPFHNLNPEPDSGSATGVRRGGEVTSQDIIELRAVADEFERAFETGDRALERGVNSRLHRRLYDIAEMPQTLHFARILWARPSFDLINAVGACGKDAAHEPDEILRALTLGDVSAAMLAMRKHIESRWATLGIKD